MATSGETKNEEEDLSADIKEWSKSQVRCWASNVEGLDVKFADLLYQQDISGSSLLLLEKSDLTELGMTLGPAKLVINARDKLLDFRKESLTDSDIQTGSLCKPYPFNRYHDSHRYVENAILDVVESGPLNLIEPCHEYKGFIHTPDENKMAKFTYEVVRFSAACMNCRTNGTIHFGIGDLKEFTHGQVLGVKIADKEAYVNALKSAVDGHFEHKHIPSVKMCIKPPRFVCVLNQDITSSEKCVIEVDIVPMADVCEQNMYHVFSLDTRKAKKKPKGKEADTLGEEQSKQFFVRDGSSTRDLRAQSTSAKPMEEYDKFKDKLPQLVQLRKLAEEKHMEVVKNSVQGSRLSQMITGGSMSLDKSHFEQYVIVSNKSHPIQLDSLGFLVQLSPIAVLDFDPESAKDGLQMNVGELNTVNKHSPVQYKITEAVDDMANKLKLTKNTSWVFCNGGVNEMPSNIDTWLMDKGASVRDVISFLCRKDMLPNKKYLVIFLLLSTVRENGDPLIETFSTFWQELRGVEQILCICENENAYTCWKDLIKARYGIDISGRCIYQLSFAEVNGTILSLLSENRKACRFLPCGGGSKVLLEKKVESGLSALDILCVNQCEGGNEDKVSIEENFYKGGKVSWWNFFFSEQPGSTPFIKRDKFDFIVNTVIPALQSSRKVCELFNLLHVPGCGGTTLAMHILWAIKDQFRCAVLKDPNTDIADAAVQVVKLLIHGYQEQSHIPVLLMIDDIEDMDKVFDLQQLIEQECVKMNIRSRSPQVIIFNCMRSESVEQTDTAAVESVPIGNDLSDSEQKQFEQKLVEIEKTHKNTKTFYGFMIMKKNFLPEYIQSVARNTLKGFTITQKNAQLIAVLVLLDVYCKGATLSVSLCEVFLGLQPKPFCGSGKIEDGFGKFSTLITSNVVEAKVQFKAVKMIHSSISWHCLQELTMTYNVKRADIANLLLNTDTFFECTQGKGKLMQDIHKMLVKRHHSITDEDSQFSPLIQAIRSESTGFVENVLQNAAKRFEKDAFIHQVLARYYLKKKDFTEANDWASKAKHILKENSYIADTSAQVIKQELKNAIASEKEVPITHEKLHVFLKMAQSATDAFTEAQDLAKKESLRRFQNRTDNSHFNTSACLGEIQVAVMVIEILGKTPIFSSGNVHHDIMCAVLSDGMKIQDVETFDPRRNKHMSYYDVLKRFDYLYRVKIQMKTQFDFLENIYVNLGSRSGLRDKRQLMAQEEVFKCFKKYADLFCTTDSKHLLRYKTMDKMMKVHSARQFLEKHKVDTASGVLNCVWNGTTGELMEKIARQYQVVLDGGNFITVKERINYIYVNVVLNCIKPQSKCCLPYRTLIDFLCKVLGGQIPLGDNLTLHFIAVALLWPHPSFQVNPTETRSLGKYVHQLKTSYHEVMREVCNGKRPIVHFYLGKMQGYMKLIHHAAVESRVREKERIPSLFENGLIWKEREVEADLCRAEGTVQDSVILADILDMKIPISPLYRSQLSGRACGSNVSFFIGFSMKGPFAIDID